MSSLQELLDKQAIAERLHLYCRSFDRMDRELAMTIWHPDGTAHYPEQDSRPFLEMYEVSEAGRRRYAQTSHQVTSLLVDLRGAEAVSEAYGFARAQEPAVDGRVVEHHWTVRWLDRWSKREDGIWRIDHRRVMLDLYSREEVGHHAIRVSPDSEPRRDRTDPVYALFAR